MRVPGDALPSVDGLIFQVHDLLDAGDVGIWELVWHLDASHADAPIEDKIRLARRAATDLISRDYDLWRGTWPEGPEAPLTEVEKRDLAHDDAAWSDPESATMVVWLRQVS